MKETTNRPSKPLIVLAKTTLILPLLLAVSVAAQESLQSIAQQEGVEWLVGKWTGTNSEGRAVALEYEWELDGHALEIDLKIGGESYKGLIALNPSDSRAMEYGADSSGGVTRAIWRIEDGKVISDRTATRPDGREIKVAVVSEKVDQDNVRATMHGYASGGGINPEVLDTVALKRLPDEDSED